MTAHTYGHNPFVNQVSLNPETTAGITASLPLCHNPFVNQVSLNPLPSLTA